MSVSVDQDAPLRERVAELEKANQVLANQLELANNELAHKSAILTQTSSELSELQTQYKQVLQKLVEMTQRLGDDLTSEAERLYREQLKEQSICIATLQDRFWQADHLNRLYRVHGYRYDRERCTCRRTADEQSEIEKLRRENAKWMSFGNKVASIIGGPTYGTATPGQLRRAILRKFDADEVTNDREHQTLKQKYEESQEYLREVQARIDRMARENRRLRARNDTPETSESETSSAAPNPPRATDVHCNIRHDHKFKTDSRGRVMKGLHDHVVKLTRVTRKIKDDYRDLCGHDDCSNYSIESLAEMNHSL